MYTQWSQISQGYWNELHGPILLIRSIILTLIEVIQLLYRLEESPGAFLQFAMMYTNGKGERRIRVINYRYLISQKLDNMYDSVDYLAFSNVRFYKYFSYFVECTRLNYLKVIQAKFVNSSSIK